MKIGTGSISSYCMENALRKRLLICRKIGLSEVQTGRICLVSSSFGFVVDVQVNKLRDIHRA
jgi:hypothetical protein